MKVEASGFLSSPNLHDGHLTGVELIEDGILHVRMLDLAGKRFIMELSGLMRLLASEFREGNIVLDTRIEHRILPDAKPPTLTRPHAGGRGRKGIRPFLSPAPFDGGGLGWG